MQVHYDNIQLENDIRQLFSANVLERFDRLRESDINFTFNYGDVYLSSFAEAFEYLYDETQKRDRCNLLLYARVFESFVHFPKDTVSADTAGIISAALYWLADYSANAYVVANSLKKQINNDVEITNLLLDIFSRQNITSLESDDEKSLDLKAFLISGDKFRLDQVLKRNQALCEFYLEGNDPDLYVNTFLLVKVLERLKATSFWTGVEQHSTAPLVSWKNYIKYTFMNRFPVIDLWPSQRMAIEKGLLDGHSSIVLKMPTSSGKTKMTELAFLNDLYTNPNRKCLYLAPYRALVSEVDKTLGALMTDLGFSVASLHGGSETNEFELELAKKAQVLIATPEKMTSILKLTEDSLEHFGTVVIDEGHLLDSNERGTSFELRMARLRPLLSQNSRVLFLSAVLPNADEVANWLTKNKKSLVSSDWQPTSTKIGLVTWPKKDCAYLKYIRDTKITQSASFFVPRIIEEVSWKEVNQKTKRLITFRFPVRNDLGTIAAALAFNAAKTGSVIIYTTRPDWANSIAKKILDRTGPGTPIETNLVDERNRRRLLELSEYLQKTLGSNSLLTSTIPFGFALHHGGIPQKIRTIIEDEYRKQNIRLLIATNTISQGVNFPAKSLVIHSLPTFETPVRDFWNLVGRAGRALKETEGEIFIIDTEKNKRKIYNFLNYKNMERLESRILSFLKRFMHDFTDITNQNIETFLLNSEPSSGNTKTIVSIDTFLLELIAEEDFSDEMEPVVNNLIENLFATYQSNLEADSQNRNYVDAIRELFHSRYQYVISKVSNREKLVRYAKSGLALESSIKLDENLDLLSDVLETNQMLDQKAFTDIISLLDSVYELKTQDLRKISKIGYIWIQSGKYDNIYEGGKNVFSSFDEAVEYVEKVLIYLTPWVLSGFLQIANGLVKIPEWFLLLPDYLKYGVNSKSLVWLMSLGFPDRLFCEWILSKYLADEDSQPQSFDILKKWLATKAQFLLPNVKEDWPPYHLEIFERVISRQNSNG